MRGFQSPQIWRHKPFLTFGLPYIVGLLSSTYVLLQVMKPTYEKKRLDAESTADLPLKRKPGKTVEEDLKVRYAAFILMNGY